MYKIFIQVNLGFVGEHKIASGKDENKLESKTTTSASDEHYIRYYLVYLCFLIEGTSFDLLQTTLDEGIR